MQAKRDAAEAAAAAAEQNVANDDDDDVFDGGGQGWCAVTGAPAAVRTSPSDDSFTMHATENQLDKLSKRLVGRSPALELSGVQDHLSITSVHSPTDYVALPTVRLCCVFQLHTEQH